MSSIKISQLEPTPNIGPNDSLPIARGTQETFRTPASQFVTNAQNIGTGPGELFSTKTSNTPTTLNFRTLSAIGENLAITTTTNTVVFEMSGQTPYKMSFLGDGSRAIWPLAPFNSVNAANYRVDIDGVLQEPFADYSLSANQIVFTDAPYLSGKVVIVSSNVVRLNEAIVAPDSVETEMLRDGCVGTAQLSSRAVTPQKLSVGGPTWTSSGTTTVNALSAASLSGNIIQFAGGSTITKAPYTIIAKDNRVGCPNNSTPANTAVNPLTFTLTRPAIGIIWANTIVLHSARADTSLYLDDVELTRTLTANANISWQPVQLYWSGLISAGTHTIDYRCTVANALGCGQEWGQTIITLYEL